MPKEKMWVEWDDGSELSQSHKKPGDLSALTREDGTNKLGHATLSQIDESEESLADFDYEYSSSEPRSDEPSVAAEAVAAVLSTLIVVGVSKAAPHARTWWADRARPTMKSTAASARERITKARYGRRSLTEPDPIVAAEVVRVEPSTTVEAAPGEGAYMSSDEARQRLVAAFIAKALSDKAKAFRDEQLRLLLNARIQDVAALKSSLENLTPEEVETHINLMLEANPQFIAEFEKMFWQDRIGDAQSVALGSDQVREPFPPPRLDRLREPSPLPRPQV